MDINKIKRNELLAQTVIEGLKSRNMTGYYADSKEKALEIALSLIPEGSTIARGGSMTVNEIGLAAALENGEYNFTNREKLTDPADKRRAELDAYDSDFFITSVNAMSKDGVLINIDGNANRVSAIAYGPHKVICIVSMNKITDDVDSAMKRARNVAAPSNMQRFAQFNTPCKKTGTCLDCKSPDSICCQFLITRRSMHKDRIHVILVNDELGF